MRKLNILSIFFILTSIGLTQNNVDPSNSFIYPESKKIEHIDTFFQKEIVDNYKWLEDEKNDETKKWVNNQTQFTKKYLLGIKYRRRIKRNLEYFSHITTPHIYKQGKYYFSFHSTIENESPSLYFRDKIGPNKTKLIDPQDISHKDFIRINEYNISKNSTYLAYSVSRNGHELKEIQIVSLPDGKKLMDLITNYVNPDLSWQSTGFAWKGDGFFYSRLGKANEKIDSSTKKLYQCVYYHKLGNSEESDSLIFARENNPEMYFNLLTTSDERFLILIENNSKTKKLNVYIDDFNDQINGLGILIKDFEKSIKFIDNIDDKIIALTDYTADNNMLVSIDPAFPLKWTPIISNMKDALLLNAQIAGEKIVTIFQSSANQYLIIFDFNGNLTYNINVGTAMNIGAFMGCKGDNELLLSVESYTKPPIFTIFDLSKNDFTLKINYNLYNKFNYDNYITENQYYKSLDGTEIPITIVRHKKRFQSDGNNMALLKAYGGYGKVIPASFDPALIYFLENGGVFAFAHIRGGGELGSNWYKQGCGYKKHNSIDDFISAAEFLIEKKFTNPAKLAIFGSSHGGFIVGAAMAKCPDLFKVVIPNVALLDLISNPVQPHEFGSPLDSSGFSYRLNLSPLHNIKDNCTYPATLAITAENDDRVSPSNAFKFTAALQNTSDKHNPHLLRFVTMRGHMVVSEYSSWLKVNTEIYSFLFHNLGVKPKW